jgi:hypothetical protein
VFVGGDSADDISRRNVVNRVNNELDRQTIARESASDRYAPSAEIIGESNEQCVAYAKRITGIKKTLGYGGRNAIEGTTPISGSIIVEKKYKHVLVAESVLETGLWGVESNFIKGHVTRRFIPYSDVIGYVYR